MAERGLAMLNRYMPTAAAQGGSQPRAWAEMAKVLAKIKRDGLGIAEPDKRMVVAGDPTSPRSARSGSLSKTVAGRYCSRAFPGRPGGAQGPRGGRRGRLGGHAHTGPRPRAPSRGRPADRGAPPQAWCVIVPDYSWGATEDWIHFPRDEPPVTLEDQGGGVGGR